MSNISRGKQFEKVLQAAFEKIPGCTIDRIPDQTSGFAGSKNICDFIVYNYPNLIYLECKSCYGNTFPFANITDTQKVGLLAKSKFKGIISGVIIWWVDKDVTKFIPINQLVDWQNQGNKSLRYDCELGIEVTGIKKRIFFDYDMKKFLDEVQNEYN